MPQKKSDIFILPWVFMRGFTVSSVKWNIFMYPYEKYCFSKKIEFNKHISGLTMGRTGHLLSLFFEKSHIYWVKNDPTIGFFLRSSIVIVILVHCKPGLNRQSSVDLFGRTIILRLWSLLIINSINPKPL